MRREPAILVKSCRASMGDKSVFQRTTRRAWQGCEYLDTIRRNCVQMVPRSARGDLEGMGRIRVICVIRNLFLNCEAFWRCCGKVPDAAFFSSFLCLILIASKSLNASSATLLDTPRGWLFSFSLLSFSYHFCLDQIGKNTDSYPCCF